MVARELKRAGLSAYAPVRGRPAGWWNVLAPKRDEGVPRGPDTALQPSDPAA